MPRLPLILLFLCAAPLAAQDHSQCSSCHTQGVSDDTAVMATIRPALPQLCINCHRERVAAGEHIINVRPVTAHPTSLPLLNGEVSCTSCHDPHGKQAAQLRIGADKLCLDCHRK